MLMRKKPNELVTLPHIKLGPKLAPSDPRLIYSYGRYGESEFLAELSGKRVAIIGPAGYMQGKGLGKLIDEFDVIVRVNHALPIAFPEDYGTRTNVLYHILSHRNCDGTNKTSIGEDELRLWHGLGLDWMICSHHANSERIKIVGPMLANKFKWACVNQMFSKSVKAQIGSRLPNTGVLAISHLLLSKLKSLNVYGFDFYLSGVYDGYGDIKDKEIPIEVNKRWHDIDAQLKYMRTLVKRDNRLIIDDTLKRVLDNSTELFKELL